MEQRVWKNKESEHLFDMPTRPITGAGTAAYSYTPYDPAAAEQNAVRQSVVQNQGMSRMDLGPGSSSVVSTPGASWSPSTSGGNTSAYGRVPNPTPIPASTFTQTSGIYPGLKQQAGQVSGNVMGELEGVLSPETIDMINQHAAEFGVSSGMPLSGFAGAQGARSLGLAVENLQQQGLRDYLSSLQGIGQTTLPPALIAEITSQNNQLAAAPDPRSAAQQMIANYQQAAQGARGSSFNPAAGSFAYSPYTSTANSPFTTPDANLTDQPALGSTQNATVIGGVPYYGNTSTATLPYGSYSGSPGGYNYDSSTGEYVDPSTGYRYDDQGQRTDIPAQ